MLRVAYFGALFACAPSFGATSYLCETEFSGQEKSKIVVHAPTGQTMFVCGKIKKVKGFNELTAFKVFVISQGGKKLPGVAFEDTSPKVYRVTNTVGSLSLQEMIAIGKERAPAYELDIACDDRLCRRAPAKCVFEAPKGASMKALEQVQAYSSGAKRGKVPPVKLMDSLARLAYAGNEDALKLFQDRGSLSLDGEVSDAYFDHQAMLKRLKKDGCLSQ